MDTGRGNFAPISEEKAKEFDLFKNAEGKSMPYFRVGEEVELKGSRFTVHSIKPKRLILKLLPKKPEKSHDLISGLKEQIAKETKEYVPPPPEGPENLLIGENEDLEDVARRSH